MGTTRTVAHALFDYTRTRHVMATKDGKLEQVEQGYIATALRGDVVEVNDVDLERGERLGALIDGDLPVAAHPAPAPALTPEVSGGSEPTEVADAESRLGPVDPAVTGAVPPRPRTVAPKPAWVDYAVARGMDRDEAEQASKDDLVARYPAG